MDKLWKILLLSILLVTTNIGEIVGQNFDDASSNFEEFELPGTDNLQKRLSKFVRIGRGLSSFIRIGRQIPFEELDFYQSPDIPNAIETENSDTENSAFFPVESENIEKPEKRLSSFVRIGRNYNDGDVLQENKRGGAFIRMGKFPSSAFLRNRPGSLNAYTSQPYYRRTGRIGHSSFIRIGKRDTSDALRRMSENKINYHNGDLKQQYKNTEENDDIDSIHNTDERRYLKIGREADNEGNENDSDKTNVERYLKIGREVENKSNDQDTEIPTKDIEEYARQNSDPGEDLVTSLLDMKDGSADEQFDKRLSNSVRIGKGLSSPNDFQFRWPDTRQQKRLSNFVRIGRNNGDLKKRISSFVRIGKRQNEDGGYTKRRLSSFVRIGKKSANVVPSAVQRTNQFTKALENADDDKENADKRISSFVRIGKSPEKLNNDLSKRYSSFVRIGKNGNYPENDLSKRYSSFVRIGRNYPESEKEYNKRLSSFIRVGKNDHETDNAYNKRFSSFVRIGKDSPSLVNKADKRYSSFVRIGKSSNLFDPAYEKRLSSFIRVGKSVPDVANGPEDISSNNRNYDKNT